MAKAKTINPCQMKGRYFRHRNPGRKYSNRMAGIVIIPSACECSCPFRNFGADDEDFITETTEYVLDKKSASPQMDFQTLNEHNQKLHSVVPCGKTFLHPDSQGTKAYLNLKKRQGIKSSFKGCYSVDEALLTDNAINYDIRESLGMYNDIMLSLDEKSYEEEIRDQNWEVILATFTDKSLRKALNSTDLRILSELIEKQGFKQEVLMEQEVASEHTKDLPDEKLTLLLKAFQKMTRLQRKAVKAYYLENWHQKTKLDVSKTLGISVDSLNDRLDLAFKKIKDEFESFKFKKNKNEQSSPEIRKSRAEARIPLPIKQTLADGSVMLFVPTKANPRPLGAARDRTDINKESIKTKVRELHLAKYGKI